MRRIWRCDSFRPTKQPNLAVEQTAGSHSLAVATHREHLGIDKFMVLGFCIGGPFIVPSYRPMQRAGSTRRVVQLEPGSGEEQHT